MSTENKPSLPPVISTRTQELKPLLELWAQKHPKVGWGILLRRALRKELAPLAGKKYAHLLKD